MADRQLLIREVFAAYDEADLEPLPALLDSDARWLGVPQGRAGEDTRAAATDRRSSACSVGTTRTGAGSFSAR